MAGKDDPNKTVIWACKYCGCQRPRTARSGPPNPSPCYHSKSKGADGKHNMHSWIKK